MKNTELNLTNTLIEAAKVHNKSLKLTTENYNQILKMLVSGVKDDALTDTQLECVNLLLDEHEELISLVKNTDKVIKGKQ